MMDNEQLVILIQAGENEAENMLQLWKQNKGYIWRIASRYRAYENMEDLEQQGYLGLNEAVRRYDAERGVPFIQYAAFWIRASIRRYIEECGSLVRLPSHVHTNVERCKRLCAEFEMLHGRRPSEWEVSQITGLSIKQVRQLQEGAEMGRMESLDSPLNDEGEAALGDAVPDQTDMEEEAVDRMQKEQLHAVLWPMVDDLPGEQGKVLRMRYQQGLTLQESGECLGVNAARARYIQDEAMRELRRPSKSKRLRPFLYDYYDQGIQGTGVERFRSTWTSATERVAIKLLDG